MHENLRNEIDRIFRVSDLMVTAHSILRDRYTFRALLADIVLLVGGAFVAAFTFLDPVVAKVILPHQVTAPILIGLAGIVIFAASLVQMKMDWKGRSALHNRAVEAYLSIKHELGRTKCFTTEDNAAVELRVAEVREHYEAIGHTTVSLPDRLFPRLKQIHRLKIEISKALDTEPATSIFLLKLKFWWRDNIHGGNP